MEIYEFEKNLSARLEEIKSVFVRDSHVPASRIRTEWAYYIEVNIEPTGWQAIWKIPRVICEELQIKYPTVVFGMVKEVLFKELKAIFSVEEVEDEVQIPQLHEVSIEDLYPTKRQEYSELNVKRTAEFIDKLRFFYNHIWMPWDIDIDDDIDYFDKHVESRLQFFYDLQKKGMKRALAAHTRTLLTEARYIQKRREYLEIELCSDDEDIETSMEKTSVTDLMRLHLRLIKIKSEMEMLENPANRKTYEEVKFCGDKCLRDTPIRTKRNYSIDSPCSVYIVAKHGTIEDQMRSLQIANNLIPKTKNVLMCRTLQDALDTCESSDEIFVPPERHSIKFLEYLNNEGIIHGLSNVRYTDHDKINSLPDRNDDAIIMSLDDDSILLVIDGNFTLCNLTLDCTNVRTGILIKGGNVCIRNCLLLGDGKSSTRQGIKISGTANLSIENSVIKDFATGLVLRDSSQVTLKSSIVFGCTVGIQSEDETVINFKDTTISNSKEYAISFETLRLQTEHRKRKVVVNDTNKLTDLFNVADMPWTGIPIFESNQLGSLIIYNNMASVFSHHMKDKLHDNSDIVSSFSIYSEGNSSSSDNEELFYDADDDDEW